MNPDLPPALRLAADRLLEGVARKGLADRAGRISQAYRSGRASAGVVSDAADATAYVLARLPATYAADLRAFVETAAIAPDFAPTSLLDAGAGPGGAGWAALEAWPGIARASLLDSNRAFLEMAETLAAEGPAALRDAQRIKGDLTRPDGWPAAELVVASYALAEIAPAHLGVTVESLWAATQGLLVVIEPGTPDGWARILKVRDQLIAAGGEVLAPCPHARACPLAAQDWCHFGQRLPRSRDHRLAKGAELPFEDEKFSYLTVARPGIAVAARTDRVLAPPHRAKPATSLKLCTPVGALETRVIAKRDKAAFAATRRLDWGDAL